MIQGQDLTRYRGYIIEAKESPFYEGLWPPSYSERIKAVVTDEVIPQPPHHIVTMQQRAQFRAEREVPRYFEDPEDGPKFLSVRLTEQKISNTVPVFSMGTVDYGTDFTILDRIHPRQPPYAGAPRFFKLQEGDTIVYKKTKQVGIGKYTVHRERVQFDKIEYLIGLSLRWDVGFHVKFESRVYCDWERNINTFYVEYIKCCGCREELGCLDDLNIHLEKEHKDSNLKNVCGYDECPWVFDAVLKDSEVGIAHQNQATWWGDRHWRVHKCVDERCRVNGFEADVQKHIDCSCYVECFSCGKMFHDSLDRHSAPQVNQQRTLLATHQLTCRENLNTLTSMNVYMCRATGCNYSTRSGTSMKTHLFLFGLTYCRYCSAIFHRNEQAMRDHMITHNAIFPGECFSEIQLKKILPYAVRILVPATGLAKEVVFVPPREFLAFHTHNMPTRDHKQSYMTCKHCDYKTRDPYAMRAHFYFRGLEQCPSCDSLFHNGHDLRLHVLDCYEPGHLGRRTDSIIHRIRNPKPETLICCMSESSFSKDETGVKRSREEEREWDSDSDVN